MVRFTIRELVLVTLIVAVALGWALLPNPKPATPPARRVPHGGSYLHQDFRAAEAIAGNCRTKPMTLRYKLRTLLIPLAVLPPLLWLGWGKYEAWRWEQERLQRLRRPLVTDFIRAAENAQRVIAELEAADQQAAASAGASEAPREYAQRPGD